MQKPSVMPVMIYRLVQLYRLQVHLLMAAVEQNTHSINSAGTINICFNCSKFKIIVTVV